MAQFYVSAKGNRGEVHRLGSKNSGATGVVAGWEGAIETHMWYDEDKGIDMVDVRMMPWKGNGKNRLIYRGPVDPDSVDVNEFQVMCGVKE